VGRVQLLQIDPGKARSVEVEALDGDPRRVELVDPTPDGGLPLDGAFVFEAGRAVIRDFVPRRMRWRGPEARPLPDFDDGLILNVSGRARSLIEALEPCVHQFLPVSYEDEAGREIEQRHFLIVCNRIDSVDRERTTMLLWQGIVWQPARLMPPDEVPPGFDASVEPRLVFDLARIGRCHIWRDKHLRQGPFVSEALVETGMSGLDWNGVGLDAA
jgi:hypothetical protein